MSHPSCFDCIYAAIDNDPWLGKHAEVECRRYPERLKKEPADWCGEFKWRPEKSVPPLTNEAEPPRYEISPLGIGTLDM